jgi:hypothetical protein
MIRTLSLVAVLVAGMASAEEAVRALSFNKGDLGKTPRGWKAAVGEWKVEEDKLAPSKSGLVLVQKASSPRSAFNLCVADSPAPADVEVSVAFKPLEGKVDQGGGIVWRYQDAKNYYLARMNPLEDNFRLYKVVDGVRKQLATKEEVTAKVGAWHTIKIRIEGDQIECSFDGKKYLEAKDHTFKKKGQVGLWSKADARTAFDSFTVKPLR